MPIRTPVKRPYFRRVDAAKAKIAAKIDRYIELHEKAAKNAADRGNSAPVEWLLSHAEILEDDGTYSRPISGSVDRPQSTHAAPGTSITIGFLSAPPPAPTLTITEHNLDATPARTLAPLDGKLSADPSTLREVVEDDLG